MKDIHLITVGKLKDTHLESLENDYLKRLHSPKLKIHEVKAHSEDLKAEAEEVLRKLSDIGKAYPILLMEKGKQLDSPKFSDWLFSLLEDKSENLVFIIGGAAGHGEKVLELSKQKISLSELTFPHKIARLLLVEQLYRAQSIHQKHPYHK